VKQRFYKDGVPQHVYVRGKGGGIIFYSLEDCVFYITLYYCLAKKHGIITGAFSLMPNHSHSQQLARDRGSFSAFNKEMYSKYALGYNRQHDREGPLFDTPFGSAPKTIGKTVKSNISYICNNGAEGGLSDGILDYRWNMVAYCMEKNPYSEKAVLRSSSRRFRRALQIVRYCRKSLKPLDYKTQELIYNGLGRKEKLQILDYILSEYNVLDTEVMTKCFGSVENALVAMEANCGSEHDMKEDWDDYSMYRKMERCLIGKGTDLRTVNFERMDRSELVTVRGLLKRKTGASNRQLDKFLHEGVADKELKNNQL
jgi:hypothetical protein